MEAAPGGRIKRAWHVAFERLGAREGAVAADFGRGAEEGPAIGVDKGLPESGRVADLDDLAEIHHRDAVGDMPHEREIVRDEDIGDPGLLLKVVQQVDDLGLD
ncbi:hypothetical protein BTHI11S_00600 [Bosea thiooxidans]